MCQLVPTIPNTTLSQEIERLMKMETAKTYTDFTDQRDKFIALVLEAVDIDDLPDINSQLCELANQAIEAGYGDLVQAERNYRPKLIETFDTIEDALSAYDASGKYGTVYRDEFTEQYLLDLTDGDLTAWLGYFHLSKWGCDDIANDTVLVMIQACSNVDYSQALLGVYSITTFNARH